MEESTNEPRPGDDAFKGFQMSLPENCVEYMLFVIDDQLEAQRTTLSSLETIRKVALQRLGELTKDYIWQREPLKLETKIENGMSYFAITSSTYTVPFRVSTNKTLNCRLGLPSRPY